MENVYQHSPRGKTLGGGCGKKVLLYSGSIRDAESFILLPHSPTLLHPQLLPCVSPWLYLHPGQCPILLPASPSHRFVFSLAGGCSSSWKPAHIRHFAKGALSCCSPSNPCCLSFILNFYLCWCSWFFFSMKRTACEPCCVLFVVLAPEQGWELISV